MTTWRLGWVAACALVWGCSGTTVGITDGGGGNADAVVGRADAAGEDAAGEDAAAEDALAVGADAAVEDAVVVGEDAVVVSDDAALPPDDAAVIAMDADVIDDAEVTTDAGPPCPFGIDETFTATLRVSVDDDRRVFVNETMVDDLIPSRTWQTISTLSVTLYRHPARANVIAVEARNYFRINGLDRGLLLDVAPLMGAPLVSDMSWRVSTASAAGYTAAAFDDSGWILATEEIQHPAGVYGALFGGSTAWWIWLYQSAVSEANKPEAENMFARRVFYVQADGQFSDTPGACP